MIKIDDLIRRIRSMAYDQQQIGYTDEDIMMYVNDGLRFVRRQVMDIYPSMIADVDLDGVLEPGENEIYAFDPISHIIDMRVDGKRLPIINPRSIPDTTQQGRPRAYYLVGHDRVRVWPIPDREAEYSLAAIRDFVPLTLDDEELPVPADLEDFVCEYCVLRASFTNEFDMSQEAQLMVTIVQGIQTMLRPFTAPGVQTRGYF